jgi:hypothetical protein
MNTDLGIKKPKDKALERLNPFYLRSSVVIFDLLNSL